MPVVFGLVNISFWEPKKRAALIFGKATKSLFQESNLILCRHITPSWTIFLDVFIFLNRHNIAKNDTKENNSYKKNVKQTNKCMEIKCYSQMQKQQISNMRTHACQNICGSKGNVIKW